MIAIDHHPRTQGLPEGSYLIDIGNDFPRAKQHMTDQDQVKATAPCQVENLARGTRFELEPAIFRPARELPAGGVKFAIAGQHPQAARIGARASRRDPDDEIVGVGGEHDRRGVVAAKLARDLGLGGGPYFAHHPVPLAIGEAGGVVPAFDLAIVTGVGPQVVAVRRHVQPAGRGAKAAREQMLEAQRSVRSDQSSGNARLVSVDSR